jgi:3-phenylpropionate/trans-cinnamate dioxygenase ferredoxin reductase subunit
LDGHPRVVIAGAGHAGGVCALALRNGGFAGHIVVVGDEPHPPYERPALSKSVLLDRAAQPTFLCPPERWSAAFDLRLGSSVVAIDRNTREVHLADGAVLSYDVLVLATGGRARSLPGGMQLPTLRTLADSIDLVSHLDATRTAVMVGGGLIGLEVAASLRTLGVDVTVVEAGPRLLGRSVPSEAADWIRDLHVSNGVKLNLGRQVVDIARSAQGFVVRLPGGESISCDLALAAIGIVPRTELAEASGLPCSDGVLVNATYQSIVDPCVYAIGDVAARRLDEAAAPVRQETWAHAQFSARTAARAILGGALEADEVPWFWTDQYKHTIQVAGEPSKADDVIARGDGVRLYLCGAQIVGAACMDAARDFALVRRLIAAQTRLDPVRSRDLAVDLRKAVAA